MRKLAAVKLDNKVIMIKTRKRSVPYKWQVRAKSNLPKQMFRHIQGWIASMLKKNGFNRQSVLYALKLSAIACCCEGMKGNSITDYYWMNGKHKFIAWQIHKQFEDDERIALLEKSKAILRIVVLLGEDKTFELIPKKTRYLG